MKVSDIKIYDMSIEDVNTISPILETEFDDFWNIDILKSETESPNRKYFVAKYNEEIVGFIGCIIIFDEVEITNVVVKKSCRGLGVSKLLMKSLLDFCETSNCSKINLEVSSSNNVAIRLYESFGFKKVGLRKKYYGDFDAILYTYIYS